LLNSLAFQSSPSASNDRKHIGFKGANAKIVNCGVSGSGVKDCSSESHKFCGAGFRELLKEAFRKLCNHSLQGSCYIVFNGAENEMAIIAVWVVINRAGSQASGLKVLGKLCQALEWPCHLGQASLTLPSPQKGYLESSWQLRKMG